jgi:SAM-dependent MidA family methyltransferase
VRVELPEPSPDERAHSERLSRLIRAEIAAHGLIGFDRYMELALYAPGLGYYSAGAAKFGRDGDFVTAPELGFVFARCLARALAPILRDTRGDVFELGPGSGALAADVLLELERLDALPARYRLLERSADLRERQQQTLHSRCRHLEKLAVWLDAPSTEPWQGALIANEVVDALPVRAFAFRDNRIMERCVATDESGTFVWREIDADTSLTATVQRLLDKDTPQPYRSEYCAMLGPWLDTVSRSMAGGAAWFIDYGHRRDAYYAPQRFEGTLRCHYRHRGHDDPLILTGLQDITAWVDFDALSDAAHAAGFTFVDLTAQNQFLVASDLADVFAHAYEAGPDEAVRYALSQEVKRLTLPQEMGEAFKVLCAKK